MRKAQCAGGHFYDADMHALCPHCGLPEGGLFKSKAKVKVWNLEIAEQQIEQLERIVRELGDVGSLFQQFYDDSYAAPRINAVTRCKIELEEICQELQKLKKTFTADVPEIYGPPPSFEDIKINKPLVAEEKRK